MKTDYNILVSGAKSGLGHAVLSTLGGIAIPRDLQPKDSVLTDRAPFDAIVHCAFNSAKTPTNLSVYAYMDDNVFLTERLMSIAHKKFIYISSIDIYPDGDRPITESDTFDVSKPDSLYAVTKLMSDLIVQARAENFLVLRPTSLVGLSMRPSTIYRVLTDPNCSVFLHQDSRFNFVLHRDIVEFIRVAIETDIRGVFNIASEGVVTLGAIIRQLQLSVTTGEHRYRSKPVDATAAAAVLPSFARPSWQTLNQFIELLGPTFIGRHRRMNGERE